LYHNFNYDDILAMEKRKIIKLILFAVVLCLCSPCFPQSEAASETFDSPIGYMAKSMVIPGLGEFYLDKPKNGKFFFVTDAVLWLFLIENLYIRNTSELHFKSLAATHAGIDLFRKDDQFFVDIGNYDSIYDYNEDRQRERQTDALYIIDSSDPMSINYYWKWDSTSSRKKFRNTRIKRDRAKKIINFTIGGMVLNRLLSMIDAAYLFRVNKAEKNISLSPDVDFQNESISIKFSWNF